MIRAFGDKARAGVPVRIAIGDQNGTHIARRGEDEHVGDVMAARIRNALVLIKPLMQVPGVEVRQHDTVLYSSIYRADDDLFVNTHILGAPAAHAPVLHLRRERPDGIAASYVSAIERVWATASDAVPQ